MKLLALMVLSVSVFATAEACVHVDKNGQTYTVDGSGHFNP